MFLVTFFSWGVDPAFPFAKNNSGSGYYLVITLSYGAIFFLGCAGYAYVSVGRTELSAANIIFERYDSAHAEAAGGGWGPLRGEFGTDGVSPSGGMGSARPFLGWGFLGWGVGAGDWARAEKRLGTDGVSPSGVTSAVRGFGLGGASGRGGCSGRGARDYGGHNPIFDCNFRRFAVDGPRNGAPRAVWMFRPRHAIGG